MSFATSTRLAGSISLWCLCMDLLGVIADINIHSNLISTATLSFASSTGFDFDTIFGCGISTAMIKFASSMYRVSMLALFGGLADFIFHSDLISAVIISFAGSTSSDSCISCASNISFASSISFACTISHYRVSTLTLFGGLADCCLAAGSALL